MNFKHKLLVLALASVGIGMTCETHAATAPRDAQAGTTGAAATAGNQAQAATSNDEAKAKTDDKTKKDQTGKNQGESNQDKLVKTLSTITVTGFSRSLESSIDYQRYSDKIENVVTAADIGGLPDQSIADALTRLPGVAAQRIGG
jgi:hypothetical protein